MRSLLTYAFCCSLLLGGCQKRTIPGTAYGAALTLQNETGIAHILSAPEGFLGKRVLIRGEVLEVCAKAGCWMEIAGDQPGQKIKVKVNDGEIIFPLTAKGKSARVEGEVYKIELSQEQARGYLAHLAEEQGAAFDASSVAGPMTIYQLKGFGAEIL